LISVKIDRGGGADPGERGPQNPVVGVLGGMGPVATCDFYAKLIAATPARTDQEHLSVVLWSDPRVPDRSEALLGAGEDPTPWLERGARFLRAAGCELVAVPCNTAHAFARRLGDRMGMQLVDMVRETARHTALLDPGRTKVGLLATTGTVVTGLYQDELARLGIETLLPSRQDVVMTAIRAVKAGVAGERHQAELAREIDGLAARGAHAVVLGCTELPLLLEAGSGAVGGEGGIVTLDPTQILAEAVVARAHGRPHLLQA
jgi:aspartate racemase